MARSFSIAIRIALMFGLVTTAAILAACGGGGGESSSAATVSVAADGRTAAIQKLLDMKPQTLEVPHGKICGARTNYSRITLEPAKWAHVAEVHAVPAANSGTEPCAIFTWVKTANVHNVFNGIIYEWTANIGRYIVDKVGDEEPGALGGKVTPFKAHFVANKLGAEIIAASIIKAPADITDGGATLHKDADGNWVAAAQ
jgi:hypothetical protein